MIELEPTHRQRLAGLFAGHYGGSMGEAVLEGHMGRAFADDETPTFGALELPEVNATFLGGDFNTPAAAEYVKNLSGIWMVFVASEGFDSLTQRIHRGKWVVLDRYPFSSENLSIEKMEQLKTRLPDGFQVKPIDVALAKQLAEDKKNRFASDHGRNFDSPADFVERGFGYCICEGNTIVSVASAFTIYNKGIEIQIDTRRSYRGKGLATVVAAYLIAHCLERNLDPGWDAANETSAKLAKKLGYTPQGTYQMYVFTDSRLLVMLRNIVQRIKKLLGK